MTAAGDAHASPLRRTPRPLSARHQALLQQQQLHLHLRDTQQQELQLHLQARPASAGPSLGSSRSELPLTRRASATAAVSRATSTRLYPPSGEPSGRASSMGHTHISTAAFPAQIHRGVGEGHDPHHVRRRVFVAVLARPCVCVHAGLGVVACIFV